MQPYKKWWVVICNLEFGSYSQLWEKSNRWIID